MKLPLEHGVGASLIVESEFQNMITLVEFQTELACVLFACEVIGNSGTGSVWAGLLIEIESAVISTEFVVFMLEFNETSVLHCFVKMSGQSQLKLVIFFSSITNHFLSELEVAAWSPRILGLKHWDLKSRNHLLCLKLIISPCDTDFRGIAIFTINGSIVVDNHILKSLS